MENLFDAKIKEINTFFLHNDLDLARRRLLDLAYDINESTLLIETVEWSRLFWNLTDKTQWIGEGKIICDKIKQQSQDL